jgi:hypothetical protein
MMTDSGANCHVRTLIEVVAPFTQSDPAHLFGFCGNGGVATGHRYPLALYPQDPHIPVDIEPLQPTQFAPSSAGDRSEDDRCGQVHVVPAEAQLYLTGGCS